MWSCNLVCIQCCVLDLTFRINMLFESFRLLRGWRLTAGCELKFIPGHLQMAGCFEFKANRLVPRWWHIWHKYPQQSCDNSPQNLLSNFDFGFYVKYVISGPTALPNHWRRGVFDKKVAKVATLAWIFMSVCHQWDPLIMSLSARLWPCGRKDNQCNGKNTESNN